VAAVVAVANRKGGSGKTTLAVNLAAILGERSPAALLDADPQGSAAAWLPDTEALPVVPVPDPEALGRALERSRGGRGLVVVDCPPFDPEITAAAIRSADLVVVPVAPSPLDLRAVAPLLDSLQASDRRSRCCR
jgi:chromosome partitioning protein